MGCHILIVDDSVVVRNMLQKLLELIGPQPDQTFQAANGREALSILKRTKIDLVITDLNMPEMNGVELVQAMARDDDLSQVPVVVIAAEGSDERIDLLHRYGIRAYVRKPFLVEDLINQLATLLSSGSEPEAASGDPLHNERHSLPERH